MPPKKANRGSGVGSKRPSSPVVPADDVDADRKRLLTECRRIANLQLIDCGTTSPFVALYKYLSKKKCEGDLLVALELARMCGIGNYATVHDGPMQFGSLRINRKQKKTAGESGTITPKHAGPNPITMAILANRLDVAELIVKEEDFRPEMLNTVVASYYRTALHCCVEACNTDGIKFLVANGADINNCIDSKGTPLYFSVYLGHVRVVELLISLGASLGSFPKMPCPYLHLASLRGWCDVVEVLLDTNKGNVDINEADSYGATALFWCVRADSLGVSNLLLSRGANVNVKSNRGMTILLQASGSSESLVTSLLDHGAETDLIVNDLSLSPLLHACRRRNEPVVVALLENGAQVTLDCDGVGPLCVAAQNGWYHSLRMVAKRYPNDLNSETVRSEWHQALFASLGLEPQNSKIVLFLIEHGADVNAEYYGQYPLEVAMWNFEVDVVKALLAKGADISVPYVSGRNAMQMAVVRNELAFMHAIVEAGGYESLEAESSNPPWLEAARRGQQEMFRALVQLTLSGTNDAKMFLSRSYPCRETDETEGDAQRSTEVSGTVLHFAASLNDAETIELLVSRGADVNVRSKYDESCPLHVAVLFNATASVNVLVAKGADINAVDKLGKTPLQTACVVVAGVLGTPLEALMQLGASWHPHPS